MNYTMPMTSCLMLVLMVIAAVYADGEYYTGGYNPGSCDGMAVDRRFECGDGTCIRDSRKCDAYIDCNNGEDENPDKCASSHGRLCSLDRRAGRRDLERCNSGMCIDADWFDDGKYDCYDKSDERE